MTARPGPQNCFELYIPDNKDQVIKACKTEADGRVVEGNHTVYRISAPTPEEKGEWIKCIRYGQPAPQGPCRPLPRPPRPVTGAW